MHLVAVGIAQVSTEIAFAVVRAFAGFAFTTAARQQAGGVGALDRQLIGGEKGQHAAVAGAGGLSVEGLVGMKRGARPGITQQRAAGPPSGVTAAVIPAATDGVVECGGSVQIADADGNMTEHGASFLKRDERIKQ